MSKYTQEDLDKALDQLMAGPIGQKKEYQWDASQRMSNYNGSRSSKELSKSIQKRMKKGWTPKVDHLLKGNIESRIPVICFDLYGRKLKRYSNMKQASIETNTAQSQMIVSIRKKGTANGYIWIKEEDFTKELLKEHVEKAKHLIKPKVGKYDKDGNLIKVFTNASEASKHDSINIRKVLRGEKEEWLGYVYKYIDK